jgi:hypothetical protein
LRLRFAGCAIICTSWLVWASVRISIHRSAEGAFTQNQCGWNRFDERFFIKRPGVCGFGYNPPRIAGGRRSVEAGRDFRSRDPDNEPDRYPLNRTPLSIILERKWFYTNMV